MTRQFLTGQPASTGSTEFAAEAQAATRAASEAAPQAASQAATPQQPLHQDALAGAFPAWDLLPATPFIRRVK